MAIVGRPGQDHVERTVGREPTEPQGWKRQVENNSEGYVEQGKRYRLAPHPFCDEVNRAEE